MLRIHVDDEPIGSQINRTKLNARLALRKRDDLINGHYLANKISRPQGRSYTEGKYFNGPKES